VLIRVVAVELDVLPSGGWVSFSQDPVESLRRAVLPAVTIGAIGAAEVGRQLRSAMVEVLEADFIRTHRAKGLPGRLIIWKHALKNSGIPLITIVGLLINGVLGATVVVEAVFALPGVGSLVVQATTQRDYPIIQGVILTYALIVLAVNLLVDISYRLLDPRIE
jgi:peptide/nickel transport system permease protein